MKTYITALAILLIATPGMSQLDTGVAKKIYGTGSLPATCNPGPPMDIYATSGQQYNCTAPKTWIAVGSSSGGLTWPGGATAGQVPQAVDSTGDLGASGAFIGSQTVQICPTFLEDVNGASQWCLTGVQEGQISGNGIYNYGTGDGVNSDGSAQLGNGNVTIDAAGNTVIGSSLSAAAGTFQILSGGAVTNGGGTPTFTVGAAAGTGATCTGGGTDLSGQVVIVIGTSPSSGVLCTITFATAGYPASVYPVLQLAAQPPCVGCTVTEAATLQASVVYTYPQAVGRAPYTGFTINASAVPTTYTWNYAVTGH